MDYVTDYAYSDERIIENRSFFENNALNLSKLTKKSQSLTRSE